jgi:phage baseplate assembly protein gpV
MLGEMGLSGGVTTKLIKRPKAPLSWRVRNVLRVTYLVGWLGYHLGYLYSKVFGAPVMLGKLEAVLFHDGQAIDYGVLGYRVVTTAFVNFVVAQLQTETSVFGDYKYHDSGVGTTAENVANTAMETTDGESRATGSQAEGASANIYKSIGTIAYTTTKAITEHGLFNDVSAGTLMDRTVFTAVNVVNGDSIQFTYNLTLTAGS